MNTQARRRHALWVTRCHCLMLLCLWAAEEPDLWGELPKKYGPEPRQWCGGETGQFQRSERPAAAAASFGRRKWNQSQHRTSFTKDRSVGNRQSWHNILLIAVLGKATVSSLMFKSCTKMHLNNFETSKMFRFLWSLRRGRVSQISFYSWKAPSVSCIHTSTWTDDLNPFPKVSPRESKLSYTAPPSHLVK